MAKLTKLRVLVADDSKASKMITMMMLESLGCELTGADDGLEALEVTRKYPFDLIFLDEKMPGLLGSEVADKLRNDSGINTNTPKISLTGIADKESIDALYKKGITHYLEKPVTKQLLSQFLQQWEHNN